MLCTGRTTGPAWHRHCDSLRVYSLQANTSFRSMSQNTRMELQRWRIWSSKLSQTAQGTEGFDPASHPRQHKEFAQMFFTGSFGPITVTPNVVTQRNGVPMFYDTASSSNLPSQYICLARNVLGRVPLTPCFVRGNRIPTLPHSVGTWNSQGAVADSRNGAGNGSRLYDSVSSTLGCCIIAAGVSHSATQGYCRLGQAAAEGSHLLRSHEGCRDSEALQGRARGRLLQLKIPGWSLMDLAWIENQWCYIASYILSYITHAIFHVI